VGVREEVDCGVGNGELSVNADAEVGGVYGYRQVQEVDSIIGLQSGFELHGAMYCVNVKQNIMRVGSVES
jgi:hypothetical protein